MQARSTEPFPPTEVAVLVLGTADWNQAIATNQHFMTREIAASANVDVVFVESMGLRSPEPSVRDLRRIAGRVARSIGRRRHRPASTRAVPDGVRIVSPLVAPSAWTVLHPWSGRMLTRAVKSWIDHPGPRVLWTYTPITYGLERDAHATVYHCVDLLGSFEGIDEALVQHHESRLAQAGAVAIASSGVVRDHLADRGFSSPLLWENVADTAVFAEALAHGAPRQARRAIFAGNLTPKKVDFDTLTALADAGWDVVVAGPLAEGGGSSGSELKGLLAAGVRHLGMLPPRALAEHMARSTLGVIPYHLNPYTRGVSPLKTFEYLAAGLGVVASKLPGVSPVPGMVATASSLAEFLTRAADFADVPTEEQVMARTQLATRHSWERRGADARSLVDRLVSDAAVPDPDRPARPT